MEKSYYVLRMDGKNDKGNTDPRVKEYVASIYEGVDGQRFTISRDRQRAHRFGSKKEAESFVKHQLLLKHISGELEAVEVKM